MTEQEYIDATNLAKVRACKNIARDMLFMDKPGKADQITVLRALRRIEARLERIVQCEPSE